MTVKKEVKHYCSARLHSSHTLWRNQRKKRRREKDFTTTATTTNVMTSTAHQSSPNVCVSPGILNKNGMHTISTPSLAGPLPTDGKYSEMNGCGENRDDAVEDCLLEEMINSDSGRLLNSIEASESHEKAKDTIINGHFLGNGIQPQLKEKNGDMASEKIGKDETNDTTRGCSQNTQDGSVSDQQMTCQLECNISIRLAGQLLRVELVYLDGQTGRDGAHQLLQYIKNKHSEKATSAQ